jgi:dTMP kinase
MKGKLIVIDGTDGSGKHTQTVALIKRLKKERYKVATLDFPQYYKNFFGKLVGKYLAGDFGDPTKISPYLASVLFAADRFESSARIHRWLKEGRIVVLDRYVSANQIHQGAKINNAKTRKEFLTWLDKMEFGVFGLPRPDAIIYLHVDPEIAHALIAKKAARAYTKGKIRDGHEGNRAFQRASVRQSLKLVQSMNNWKKIECVAHGQILPPEEIAEKIWTAVSNIITRL